MAFPLPKQKKSELFPFVHAFIKSRYLNELPKYNVSHIYTGRNNADYDEGNEYF